MEINKTKLFCGIRRCTWWKRCQIRIGYALAETIKNYKIFVWCVEEEKDSLYFHFEDSMLFGHIFGRRTSSVFPMLEAWFALSMAKMPIEEMRWGWHCTHNWQCVVGVVEIFLQTNNGLQKWTVLLFQLRRMLPLLEMFALLFECLVTDFLCWSTVNSRVDCHLWFMWL